MLLNGGGIVGYRRSFRHEQAPCRASLHVDCRVHVGRLQAPHASQWPSITAMMKRGRVVLDAQAGTEASVAQPLRVSLPTGEVRQALSFEAVPRGRGQAIVVADVQPGSSCEQAGIRPGLRLTAISDPIRESELWPIGDSPSMRFVRDTFRMRRSGIINLQFEEFLGEQQVMERWLSRRSQEEGAAAVTPGSEATATVTPAPSADTRDSWAMLGLSGSDSDPESRLETIGERLARQQAEEDRSRKQVSDVQQRIQRRQDYMDQVEQRSDVRVVVWAALAFLGPAAVILGIAYWSGYLDKLYDMY